MGTIEGANSEVVRRISASEAVLVDVGPAGELLSGLSDDVFLHAGPPLAGWHEACGALRGAVIGTLLHDGRAEDPVSAESMATSEKIRLVSASEHNVLATYGGVINSRTQLLLVENGEFGTRAYAALNEGRGNALRYGSHDADTLRRYAWMEGEFAATLRTALQKSGGIDLFEILREALQMGDDGHSRQKAAGALFANEIGPTVAGAAGGDRAAQALNWLAQNEIFFLPLTMAATKAAMLSAEGIANASVVTAMAGNGVRWGIQVSGGGRRWFTAPVPEIAGRYFPGYDSGDASPVIGDSEIAETFGLGAFAMTGAPALARYMGGSVDAMREISMPMYEITVAEHPRFKVPALDYRGTPLGIDVMKVLESGIQPVFNTGIAHREPGIGQIGAGYGRVPMACLEQAAKYISEGGQP